MSQLYAGNQTSFPWQISTSGGGATLSWTDPITGQALTQRFADATAAQHWALGNVMVLPDDVTLTKVAGKAGTVHWVLATQDPFWQQLLHVGASYTFDSEVVLRQYLTGIDAKLKTAGYQGMGLFTTSGQTTMAQERQNPNTRINWGTLGVSGPSGIASPYQLGSPAMGQPVGAATTASPADQAARAAGHSVTGPVVAAPGAPPIIPPGGSGGGGNYPTAPTELLPGLPNASNAAQIEAYIRAHYGYESWMLDIPELKDLLVRSVQEKFFDNAARFAGELGKTQWWQANGQTVYEFLNQEGADPATTQRRIAAAQATIQQAASQAGITLSTERAQQIARDQLMYGWTPDQVNTVLTNEFHYQPDTTYTGDIAYTAQRIKADARSYMLPLTDQQAFDFAQKIYGKTMDEQGVLAMFAQQASARFPALAASIAAGIRPETYFSSYQTHIAQLLDVPVQSIDLMNDPRFQPVIDMADAKGNRRPMTLSEVDTFTRHLPAYDQTQGAKTQAYNLVDALGRLFGKSAA